MSEDVTGRLDDGGSFESRVLEQLAALRDGVNSLGGRLSNVEERLSGVEARLSELDARVSGVETRLSAVEEKVDARLRETRPIWEAVLSRLEIIDSKLEVVANDLLEMRAETNLLKKRLPPAARFHVFDGFGSACLSVSWGTPSRRLELGHDDEQRASV
jgi:predicted nuclease with TOPRIM domain